MQSFRDACEKYEDTYIPLGGPGIPDLTYGEMTKTLEGIAGVPENHPQFTDRLREQLDNALIRLKQKSY